MKNPTDKLLNTQSSAHARPVVLTASGRIDRVRYAFDRAIACYKKMTALESSALLEARNTGHWLNKAKPEVKQRGGQWLAVLKREFEEIGSIRRAQDCMRIDREWKQLETVMKKHTDLSIAGALRFLKTGSVELKQAKKTFDHLDLLKWENWKLVFERAWHSWTANERDWVRWNPTRLEHKLEELRKEIRGGSPGRKRRIVLDIKRYQFLLGQITPEDCYNFSEQKGEDCVDSLSNVV
jgi:hypothetical protein